LFVSNPLELPELLLPGLEAAPVAREFVVALLGPSVLELGVLLMVLELLPEPEVSPVLLAPPCSRLQAVRESAAAAQRMTIVLFIADSSVSIVQCYTPKLLGPSVPLQRGETLLFWRKTTLAQH
jgi:hypothetical protein